MAILGLGTNIVEITRIEAIVSRSGDHLARRVFSDNKWAIWEAYQWPAYFLAKCFAVKEAVIKALSMGIYNRLASNQFGVLNDEPGKSCLRLWREALKLAGELGVAHIYVMLTDERHYAHATVIIESQVQDVTGWRRVTFYSAYGLCICCRGRVGASLPDGDAAEVY